MEHKTIFGKIFGSIFNIFKSNWPKLIEKLFNNIPSEVVENITIAIVLVEKLKKWLNSDRAQDIVSVLPGHWDNDIRDWAVSVLNDYDFSGVDELLPKDSHSIAATLTSKLTGFSFGQSALTTEVVYQAIKSQENI